MSTPDVIRAWKDADYLASLSEAQRAVLPAHPVGAIELETDELSSVAGGGPHNSSIAQCTPLQVCHSQRPLTCPSTLCTQVQCVVWG